MIRHGSADGPRPDEMVPSPLARPVSTLLESRSLLFQGAVAAIERTAKYDGAIVLLVGDSGTGKSLLAHHLHQCSPRRNRIFHRVSLASMADGLASSDLFGHLQGAFTDARSKRLGHFAEANGGTLFLDEIGRASEVVQHRLLDAVERQEVAPVGADRSIRVDVRLIAASNVCLRTMSERGTFLPDLYARLEAFTIRIPSLDERREDIPALARHFVRHYAAQFAYSTPPRLSLRLLDALASAAWPRNVRQLDGAIRRILVDAEGAPELSLDHWRTVDEAASAARSAIDGRAIRDAIAKAPSKTAAARELGISRSTLYRHIDDLGAREPPPDPDLQSKAG